MLTKLVFCQIILSANPMKRKLKNAIYLIFDFNLSLILENKVQCYFFFSPNNNATFIPKKFSISFLSDVLLINVIYFYSTMVFRHYG